jgi:hypothetical protein
MALKKREKILLILTVVMVVVVGFVLLSKGAGGERLGVLRGRNTSLAQQKSDLEEEAAPGRQAAAKLAEWRKRALPEDHDLAFRLYNSWLELTIEDLGMRGADITPSSPVERGVYTVLRFKVQGQWTLDQITRFLYQFYAADYLHKVNTLNLNPVADSRNRLLTTVMTIEALCVQGADHESELPSGGSSRLAHAKLDEYRRVILQRHMESDYYASTDGLFASYTPKPRGRERPPREEVVVEPPPTTRPQFDFSQYTYLSSIQNIDGQKVVWLRDRPRGVTHRLKEGDPFEVGSVGGEIALIQPDEEYIEFENGNGRWRLDLGNQLQQSIRVR